MLGCFQPTFAKKRLRMSRSSNTCQSFRITAKALKLLGVILHFMYFSEKSFMFGWAFQIVGRDKCKIKAKKENISFFHGFRREYVQIVPEWLVGP